jgi:hypothetical protein
VLRVATVLYVHGATHLLRWRGACDGGETPVPTRPAPSELRHAVTLLAAVAALVVLRR